MKRGNSEVLNSMPRMGLSVVVTICECGCRPRYPKFSNGLSIQASLLDFFNAHSHHFWNVALFGCKVYQWDTENPLRETTETMIGIESRLGNRSGKRMTERRPQIGIVCPSQGFLDFRLSRYDRRIWLLIRNDRLKALNRRAS